eukprot:CAMPEP_0175149028 /NCGR_PEP_ID=MMETSP0087-20121206/16986_1 /TAXON_ID=136419 /ORGANISM="Unknown Unknown, Strain D1" /LENGTH=1128 /DNA_ID=CAMNT_0016434615 /DNA_START=83 /DNA_END=3466 /DNA_ORIENTATION=+
MQFAGFDLDYLHQLINQNISWGTEKDRKEAERIRQGLKTESEIARYTMDENLSEVELQRLFLSSGDSIQVTVAVTRIPTMCREHPSVASELLRLAQQHMSSWDVEVQRKAASVYSHMFESQQRGTILSSSSPSSSSSSSSSSSFSSSSSSSPSPSSPSSTPFRRFSVFGTDDTKADCSLPPLVFSEEQHAILLDTVLPLLQVQHDPEQEKTAKLWLQALGELVPLLSISSLRRVGEYSLATGDISSSNGARRVSATMLGMVLPKLAQADTTDTFVHQLLSHALGMCQDTWGEVRQSMAANIAPLAAAFGTDLTLSKLLPELEELLGDEERSVKQAALKSLVALWGEVPPETRQNKIAPILMSLCQRLSTAQASEGWEREDEDDEVLMVLEQFGDFVLKLQAEGVCVFSASSCVCYTFFAYCCRHPRAEIRFSAAFQFPAAISLLAKKLYAVLLHPLYTALCADTQTEVRLTLSASLQCVVSQLGVHAFKYTKGVLVKFLRDENTDVQVAVLRQLLGVLHLYKKEGPDIKEVQLLNYHSELLKACLEFDQQQVLSWRRSTIFLEAAQGLPRVMDSSTLLFDKLLPVLLERMRSGLLPVKRAAAAAVCELVRFCAVEGKRCEAVAKLIKDFGQSSRCADRMCFLELCLCMFVSFSRRWFKKYALQACLLLSQDPVANVRCKFTSLLPYLKRLLQIPSDNYYLDLLTKAAAFLRTDKDKDVANSACLAMSEMSRVDVQNDSLAALANYLTLSDEDKWDKEKEREEEELLRAEEALKDKKTEVPPKKQSSTAKNATSRYASLFKNKARTNKTTTTTTKIDSSPLAAASSPPALSFEASSEVRNSTARRPSTSPPSTSSADSFSRVPTPPPGSSNNAVGSSASKGRVAKLVGVSGSAGSNSHRASAKSGQSDAASRHSSHKSPHNNTGLTRRRSHDTITSSSSSKLGSARLRDSSLSTAGKLSGPVPQRTSPRVSDDYDGPVSTSGGLKRSATLTQAGSKSKVIERRPRSNSSHETFPLNGNHERFMKSSAVAKRGSESKVQRPPLHPVGTAAKERAARFQAGRERAGSATSGPHDSHEVVHLPRLKSVQKTGSKPSGSGTKTKVAAGVGGPWARAASPTLSSRERLTGVGPK